MYVLGKFLPARLSALVLVEYDGAVSSPRYGYCGARLVLS